MISTALALGATVVVLATVGLVGVLATRGRAGDVESFISARNTTGGGTLVATLVASSMGAWILFSPAEAGAAFGGLAAVVGYAVGSALPVLGYSWLGPRIRALIPEGHTLTEYALARYGPAMYAYVLLVSVAYMFVFLAAEMTGITLALDLVAGVPRTVTAALVGGVVLLYTAYGGLRASMITDALQTLVVLPLLAVGFGAALLSLGGAGAVYEGVAATDPSLLDPGFAVGVEFGIYVSVAILAAEMLNQAWWQRIYAARDDATLARSFRVAALVIVPMVLLSGLFGLAAVGLGVPGDQTAVAFFYVVNQAFPDGVVLAVVVLAVLLVSSTADTLFNALASVVTADLPRVVDPDVDLTWVARGFTVVVALGAIVIGAQGYSVLTVFFIADLLAAATFVPLLAGLYTEHLPGVGALAAALAGLVVGALLFPIAPFALPQASFFNAFLGAAGVSAVATVLATAVGARLGHAFDLGRLSREVRRLDREVPADD